MGTTKHFFFVREGAKTVRSKNKTNKTHLGEVEVREDEQQQNKLRTHVTHPHAASRVGEDKMHNLSSYRPLLT